MSLRKLSDTQVSDGCVISGVHLDKLMDDATTKFNNIEKGRLRRRFCETQFIAGYLPDPINAVEIPFLPSVNEELTTLGTVPSSYDNTNRFKGIINAQTKDALTYKLVWTIAQYFKKPVIIRDVTVFLLTDRKNVVVYDNTFTYGATAPAGKANKSVDDINVILSCDSVFHQEHRKSNSLLLNKSNFEARTSLFSTQAPPTTFDDLTTSHPAGAVQGLAIRCQKLNIPVHRDARIRLSVCIPKWADSFAPFGVTPVDEQYYSIVMSVLEEIEE